MINVAIDIGGSKIALCGRNAQGIVFTFQIPLSDRSNPQHPLSELAKFLSRQVEEYGHIGNLGIGSAPNIDSTGCISRWPNRPAWEGLNIIDFLEPFANGEIRWCDDGMAATLADANILRTDNLVHFSLGTGVGGGILYNCRPIADCEVGHLTIHPDGKRCSCGRKGCLQAYASGASYTQHMENSRWRSPENIWLASAAKALAICIGNLIELFSAPAVTLSGGLTARFSGLPRLVETVMEKSIYNRLKVPRILLSPNGTNASLQGAILLAEDVRESIHDICRTRRMQ